MNLLFVSTTYPTPLRPKQGMFNRNLVAALRVHHDVRVIAPVPWREYKPWRECKTLSRGPSLGLDSQDLHPVYYYTPKLFRKHYHRFYWHSILPAVRQLERSFTPDLVLGYWMHPDGAAAQRVAQRFDVPFVAFSGGSDLRRLPANSGRRRAVQRVLADADRLVVVSRDLAEIATALGMPAEKIDVVYRGVDQDCFRAGNRDEARDACQIPREAIVLLWSGRLEAVKNPRMLLHAAARWQDRWGDRLRVLVAGDGSMSGEMKKLQAKLHLQSSVRFEGNLRQEELALRYNAADLTVLTSHSEGIPNVLLESISCGTPFVATDVGGVSEIASPNIDQLVADDDIEALVQAVVQRIESPSEAPRVFQPDGLAEMAARFNAVFDRTLLAAKNNTTEVV